MEFLLICSIAFLAFSAIFMILGFIFKGYLPESDTIYKSFFYVGLVLSIGSALFFFASLYQM